MLNSTPLQLLLRNNEFLKSLRYFVIDECHLVEQWGRSFRSAYDDLVRMRNRLETEIIWLTLSATVRRIEISSLSSKLGFSSDPARCNYIILPVDRLTITYAARFFRHSTSERHFLDLSWVIPLNAQAPSNIPITLIFTDRIQYGNRLIAYLTNLLPDCFQGVARWLLVRPYNALISLNGRTQAAAALQAGVETRILVCTDAGAFGIDMPEVQQVVVAVNNGSSEFRSVCQKIGRIQQTGLAVIYSPKWMNQSRTNKQDSALRAKAEPVMVEFAKAPLTRCPRAVNCEYWGCDLELPTEVSCCNRHDSSIDEAHMREVEARAAIMKQLEKPKHRGPKATGEHRPLHKKSMQPVAFLVLSQWRVTTWLAYPDRTPLCPPQKLISDKLLQTHCRRMHVCTTWDRFRALLVFWDRLDTLHGQALFQFVQSLLKATDVFWHPATKRSKHTIDGRETEAAKMGHSSIQSQAEVRM